MDVIQVSLLEFVLPIRQQAFYTKGLPVFWMCFGRGIFSGAY